MLINTVMSESKNDRYFSEDSRFADYGVDENRTEISYQSADIFGGVKCEASSPLDFPRQVYKRPTVLVEIFLDP